MKNKYGRSCQHIAAHKKFLPWFTDCPGCKTSGGLPMKSSAFTPGCEVSGTLSDNIWVFISRWRDKSNSSRLVDNKTMGTFKRGHRSYFTQMEGSSPVKFDLGRKTIWHGRSRSPIPALASIKLREMSDSRLHLCSLEWYEAAAETPWKLDVLLTDYFRFDNKNEVDSWKHLGGMVPIKLLVAFYLPATLWRNANDGRKEKLKEAC